MRLSDLQTAWFLASRSVWRGNRAVLFLTPLIICLAVLNLLFFDGLFAGLYKSIDRQVIDNLFGNILIEPPSDDTYIVGANSKINSIASVPGVMASAPHYKSGALFSFDKDHDGRQVTRGQYSVFSIEPDKEPLVTAIKSRLIAGRYLTDTDRDAVVMGVEAAGGPLSMYPRISLGGVSVGDTVYAVYPNGVSRTYTVVGIYKTGVDFADSMVFVTHKEMEGVLGIQDVAMEILVKTAPNVSEADVVPRLRQIGLAKEKITPYYDFLNYVGATKQSFDFLKVITSLVSLIIVTITVFIVMYIHVTNKKRQLGILRALGISESTIVLSYIFQAVVYCVVGLGVGCIIMFGFLIPFFLRRPLDAGFGLVSLYVNSTDAIEGILIITGTNLIAGYIPARLAIRRTIISALWGN